jgi:outer membrane protein TolC
MTNTSGEDRGAGMARSAALPAGGLAGGVGVLWLVLGLGLVTPAWGQTPADSAGGPGLDLGRALELAQQASESVIMAQAAVLRAHGQQLQARSQLLPQIGATAGYTRTLATEFSALQSADTVTVPPAPEGCSRYFQPSQQLPLDQRVDSLEKQMQCQTNTNPFAAFGSLPFGRANEWTFGFSVSQTVFAGGRLWAQNHAASAGRRVAEIALNESRAQLALQVTQAYYDAALSDRMLRISQASLAQAQGTLDQAQLAEQVGEKPEFDLLRARVARDNQRAMAIQQQASRNQAFDRLKQLLGLPMDSTVDLTTPLGDSLPSLPAALVNLVSEHEVQPFPVGDTSVVARAPVRQAMATLQVQQDQASVARSARFPSLVLSSQYARVAYPSSGLPSWSQFLTNWTVGVSLQIPVFTGGRIHGDELVAQANVMEAQAQLKQTQELAELDNRSALDALRSAQASWQASAHTVEQATQAYSIAEVRYREGISTQLELDDSRILLQQSEANRAQAARDLQVARARVLLLPYLPLGAASSSSGSAAVQTGVSSGAASAGSVQAAPQGSTGTQATQAASNPNGTGNP